MALFEQTTASACLRSNVVGLASLQLLILKRNLNAVRDNNNVEFSAPWEISNKCVEQLPIDCQWPCASILCTWKNTKKQQAFFVFVGTTPQHILEVCDIVQQLIARKSKSIFWKNWTTIELAASLFSRSVSSNNCTNLFYVICVCVAVFTETPSKLST